MSETTRARWFYTLVIAALISILVSAVIINRTFVNTPTANAEYPKVNAGEATSAYMCYTKNNGETVIGISKDYHEKTKDIIYYVENMPLGAELAYKNIANDKATIAWVTLYDENNNSVCRVNFYDKGSIIQYNGKCYESDGAVLQQIVEYCNECAKNSDGKETDQ